MNDRIQLPYGDPLTAPFWEAAAVQRLLIQQCRACGHHQFYPRPFCLNCQTDRPAWVAAAGTGVVYSATTFLTQFAPEFPVPYTLAIVQLDEGPRLMTNLEGGPCRIGDRVRIGWRLRSGAPPLPIFRPIQED